MAEHEHKLTIDPDVELPAPKKLLAGLGDWAVEEIDQEAVYFDTPDLRLTRSGVSLRFRSDDGWTLKLPVSRKGAEFVREELAFAGDDPETLPSDAVDLVRAWACSSPLGDVARIRTHRRKLQVSDAGGRSLGEIDDDDVTAFVTHQTTTRFREIEVEMDEDVAPRLVDTMVKRLRKAGAGNGRSMPKIARVLGDPALEPPDLLPPQKLDRRATLGQLVRASIAGSVKRLLDHDPVIRMGDHPEGVHQARVATRRLRSDLRTFRPILDQSWSEPLRDELKWLGEQLGHVRDADVLLGLLTAKIDAISLDHQEPARELITRLENMRERDRACLLEAMRSSRYAELLDRLVDAANSPVLQPGLRDRRAAKQVDKLAAHPWKKLRTRVRELPDPPANQDLHEVRKRAKQARYALEAISPITGSHAKRTAKRLADLQDVLGDHQDTVVAVEWLEEAAHDSGGTERSFAAGALAGSFAADGQTLRGQWQKRWKRARRSRRSA